MRLILNLMRTRLNSENRSDEISGQDHLMIMIQKTQKQSQLLQFPTSGYNNCQMMKSYEK